jgi:hypothetical protein
MSLIAAKCPNCGANVQVDESKESGICIHCNTSFITEKAINNYNTYVSNTNTTNVVKNIYGNEKREVDDYIYSGEGFLNLKMYEKAIKAFSDAMERPQ